jgi:hypothetical protein
MGTGCGPIASLRAGYSEGAGSGVREKKVLSGMELNLMFLRNVGIDLQIHTAPKPKTSTTT